MDNDYKEKYNKLIRYNRDKINHMLSVVGTKGIREEELTDDMIIELDPIGIVTDSFQQILDNLKETNEDLLIAKNEIEATFNSIGVGLMVIDKDRNIIAANKMHSEMFNCNGTDVTGSKCYSINCDKNSFSENCYANEIFSTGSPVHVFNWERKGKKFELVGTPVKNSAGEIVYAVVSYIDVTDKMRMEQELLKNQKLESLSIMAAGIAHDFNNMLTSAFSNLSLMRLDLTDKDMLLESIESTEKALSLAKNLVRQVSTFAIGGAPILKTVKIQECISDICDFTMSGSNCTLSIKFENNLKTVDVDVTQFNQVINNIILNSQQAMPDGGKIEISVMNRKIEPNSEISAPVGDYIEISIKDNGPGIREDHIANIFDPFYTTKSRGSGIGLATAYSIVKRHKGFIFAESEFGKWTDFKIYIPVSKAAEKNISDSAAESDSGRKKYSGRILIMDDDRMILKATGSLLTAYGYDIDTALDGESALFKIEESINNKNQYDLVIFDLVIPGGMGGIEAVKKLSALNSGIKSIVSSGYSNDEVLSNYGAYGFNGIVPKPYRMEDLISEINRVLLKEKSA